MMRAATSAALLLLAAMALTVLSAADLDESAGLKVIDFRETGTPAPDARSLRSSNRAGRMTRSGVSSAGDAGTESRSDGAGTPLSVVHRGQHWSPPGRASPSPPAAETAGDASSGSPGAHRHSEETRGRPEETAIDRSTRERLLSKILEETSDIVCSDERACCYRLEASPAGIVIGPIDPARQRDLLRSQSRPAALERTGPEPPRSENATPPERTARAQTQTEPTSIESIREGRRRARVDFDRTFGDRDRSRAPPTSPQPSDQTLRDLRSSIVRRTLHLRSEKRSASSTAGGAGSVRVLDAEGVQIRTSGTECGDLLDSLHRTEHPARDESEGPRRP